MDYQHKEKNVPKWIYVWDVITCWLPDINSISGLLFYTFVIYVFRILIKVYCAKPLDYDEDSSENNDIIGNNKDLLRRIEENRKTKAKEAEKLLKKIT